MIFAKNTDATRLAQSAYFLQGAVHTRHAREEASIQMSTHWNRAKKSGKASWTRSGYFKRQRQSRRQFPGNCVNPYQKVQTSFLLKSRTSRIHHSTSRDSGYQTIVTGGGDGTVTRHRYRSSTSRAKRIHPLSQIRCPQTRYGQCGGRLLGRTTISVRAAEPRQGILPLAGPSQGERSQSDVCRYRLGRLYFEQLR